MNNVIPLHRTQDSYEIVVFDADASDLRMQALRENKTVIVKLESLQAHRLLDFVSGSAYAISAHPVKVGRSVFLFIPYNIQTQSRLAG